MPDRKFDVLWTQSARYDLESIVEFIKTDSPDIAKKTFDQIRQRCEDLYFFPERNRIVPELRQIGITKYRELIYKRWRVVYKIDKTTVYILLVVDASRNLEDLLLQRLLRMD